MRIGRSRFQLQLLCFMAQKFSNFPGPIGRQGPYVPQATGVYEDDFMEEDALWQRPPGRSCTRCPQNSGSLPQILRASALKTVKKLIEAICCQIDQAHVAQNATKASFLKMHSNESKPK